MPFVSGAELVELVGVILVDLVLSADNAIVVGIAVAGLPAKQRLTGMVYGIAGATLLRVVFAAFTVQLLAVVGLLLAGGLLLLWVCWKLFIELRASRATVEAAAEGHPKTLKDAIWQIVVADVSMALDNVLAVAGIAREHLWVLAVGLVLSVAFMGLAAALISRLLGRYPWIAYLGLAVILFVALEMIYDGALELWSAAAA